MPSTPVTWLNEFFVTNEVNPQDPDIIQLANGNILVSWSSTDDTGAGTSSFSDVVGQIFDPLGNPIGSPIQLNFNYTVDDELNSDLVALPGGGFIVVYQDNDVGGFTDLRLDEYDANGNVVSSAPSIVEDGATGLPSFRNPHVAASSDTSVLIVFEQTNNSGTTVVGKFYNPATNTYSAQQSFIGFAFNVTDPDVAVLTNGNYVISATDVSGGDARIAYRIVDSDGNNILSASFIPSTSADGFTDNEASVTALTGGGFVITYTDRDSSDTDVAYSVFNAAGTEIGSGLAGLTGGSITNDNNESAVCGLADGSFVIILDNDEANTMEATHVSASGTVLGSFSFSGSGTEPAVTDLGDGRFAVTWEDNAGGVKMEILDTRDFINDAGVYSPNEQQIGTIFDDTFTADGISEIVHGWKGNDTITENGQIRSYFGDEGDDTLIAISPINSDMHDGGDGTDTIDWNQNSVSGATFDLAAGTAIDGSATEVMVNFENAIGTNQDDVIKGTAGANVLAGKGGNDLLEGRGGADYLTGGLGSDRAIYANAVAGLVVNLSNAALNTGEAAGDTYNSVENLTGSGFDDTLTGTTGTNSIIAGAGDDTVIGLNGSDNLFGQGGNDILNGGAGADALNGGADSDRVTYETAAAAVIASLLTPASNTGEAAGDTYTSIENLTGSAFNDTLTGNSGTNSLLGGTGADIIVGLGGNDNLFGQDDNDVLNGGTGADALNGGAGSDRATYENATSGVIAALLSPATNTSEAAGDTFTSVESLTGSTFNDKLTGTNSLNSLIGGAGNDTLIGLGGDDNLFGQDGNDTLIGGVGADDMSGGNNIDTTSYDTAAAGVVASLTTPASNTGDAAGDKYSSIENLTGSAFNDTLTGNSAINVILGGNGNDTLNGRAGNDMLTGGAGNDNFIFDTAVGATNVDTINDFNFVNDTIRLENSIFNAIVGVGTLTAAQFVASASGAAADASDRIIYETDTGKIFYDTNGNAAGGSTQIATVTAGLGITNADFFIV